VSIACYRVSTAKQGRSGLGLEAQEAAVKAYIAATGSKLLAPPYREIETGTSKRHRPVLARAIAHAKRAQATLIAAKIDRLTRNLAFLSPPDGVGRRLGRLRQPERQPADGSHPGGRRRKRSAGDLSAHEGRARRCQGARHDEDRQAVGEAKRNDNLAKVDRAKASAAGVDAIKRNKAAAYADLAPMIADLAAQGLSLRAIAARLNDQGEVTRRGRRWAAAAGNARP
jgi:hypothetical protein